MSHGATTKASRVRCVAYIPPPRLRGTPRDWLQQVRSPCARESDGLLASRVEIPVREAIPTLDRDLLSYGQKRLLSFYWYLAVRADQPVVADELANGLHYEWIDACVNELSERQSFLATQNPLLMDYLPAGNRSR